MYKFNKRKVYKKLFSPAKKLNKRQKKEVKSIVNANLETKAVDTVSGIGAQYGATTTSTTLADMTAISSGYTALTRVGEQIRPLSLQCRYFFDQQTTVQNQTRLIIFIWRPDNATAPVLSDILDPGAGGSPNVFSFHNYDKRELYTILYDKSFVSNPSIANSNNLHQLNFTINLRKHPKVNYNLTANTGNHHIYHLLIGSNTIGATSSLFTYANRLFFKDA